MDDDLVNRIADIATDVLGEEPGVVSGPTTPDDLESWDSLAQLNLVVALEDEFSIQIPPEDIDLMTSIAAIADLVGSRLSPQ